MGMSSPRAKQAWWTNFWVGVCFLALGLLAQLTLNRPDAASGQLIVRVLDVGQGDAILVTTPHGEQILLDGGPDERVVEYLKHYLIPPQRLRLMIASHNHADHIAGLIPVLDRFSTEESWMSGSIHTSFTYERYINKVKEKSRVKIVKVGDSEVIDGVTLSVLFPLTDATGDRPDDQHDTTLVVKLQYGATSFLLTGDLDEDHERMLIEHDPAVLHSSVLKVTHHGSHYGSTSDFLTLVDPQYSLISAGSNNKFGHPHPATLDRLSAQGGTILRTDLNGTLTCRSNGIVVGCDGER